MIATKKHLIDADAYIEEYETAANMARKIGGKDMDLLADFYYEVIEDIKKRPTVDAVEVVHGSPGPSYMDEYYGEWKNCLECGADNIWPSNYCRICGAKMDGK